MCINVKSTQCLRHIRSRQSMLFVGHLQFDSISFERYVLHLTIAYLSIHSVVLSQLHIAKVVQFSVYFVLCFRFLFFFIYFIHSFTRSLALTLVWHAYQIKTLYKTNEVDDAKTINMRSRRWKNNLQIQAKREILCVENRSMCQ